MAFLDPVNTIATKHIVPGVVDNIFKNSPLLAYFRRNSLKQYAGGPQWQENFLYNTLKVAAYAPGDSFDIGQRQIATGGTVTPRYYNVPVPAYIEKLKIEMNGPEAVFDYIDLLMQAAALTMSATLAIDLYQHGQNQGTDRSLRINGLDEALSDGTTSGFNAQTYANYLTLSRTGDPIGSALNSPMAGPAANVAGAISYPTVEQAWQSVVIGGEQPDLICTTNLGLSYLKMAFQAQQRFETSNPDFGFQGIKFNGSSIMADQYAPGTRAALTNEGDIGYAAVASGETLWFLNTKTFRLYLSTDPLFGFGFTGFMPAQNNSTVVGHYKFCGNFTCTAPRLSRYLFGITG